MKISIITVCYNSSATIEDTLKSVQAQTYKDIEYIIVDGKSKDNTLEIVDKYKNTVSIVVSEKDKGLYDAMNKGIALANGDVIGIINSDDLFCDDKAIEKVMYKFKNNPQLEGVYADLFYVAQFNTDKIVRNWRTGAQKSFYSGWHPAHPTFYVKKEVYNKYGLFNLNFKIAADFELMLRFIEKNKIKVEYLPEPTVKMRLGGESNKNLKNIYFQNIECLNAFKVNDLPINKFYTIKRILSKVIQYF